jgi:hypothetical protein
MTLLQTEIPEFIKEFTEHCRRSKHWKTYENQELIQTETGFHKIVWLQEPQARFFENSIKHPISVIRDELSYRAVRHDFTAFVSLNALSAEVTLFFEESPSLSNWVALYDLSAATKHPSVCSKTNYTKSEVFQEFEKFLNSFYRIRFNPLYAPTTGSDQFQVYEASPPKTKHGLLPRLLSMLKLLDPKEEKMELNFDDKTRYDPFIDNFKFEGQCRIGACMNCIATNSARTRPITT